MRNRDELICLQSGAWSQTKLNCAKSCTPWLPFGPEYFVRGAGVVHGSVRSVECAPGHKPQTASADGGEGVSLPYQIRCSHGEWDAAPFWCERHPESEVASGAVRTHGHGGMTGRSMVNKNGITTNEYGLAMTLLGHASAVTLLYAQAVPQVLLWC